MLTNQKKVWTVMVNNSSNINKPKESFTFIPPISTNQKKVWTVLVNNYSNINKPKESFNSDGQQFLQYQQAKRKFEQWWSAILLLPTNINKPKESLNSDGQQFFQYQPTKRKFSSHGRQFYQYQQTKRKFKQWWSTILPISTKQKKVLTVMVNNSYNINKPKESFSSDGRKFYQYQQTKRKLKEWWSTILPISTNQKKV